MRCLKGFELEEVHDATLRFYLEALAAAKMAGPNEKLDRVVKEKAAALQIANDELVAHFKDCPACRAGESRPV